MLKLHHAYSVLGTVVETIVGTVVKIVMRTLIPAIPKTENIKVFHISPANSNRSFREQLSLS